MRKLSPQEMRSIKGAVGQTGSAFSWQADAEAGPYSAANTANGNHLTVVPVASFPSRGGVSVSFSLAHNSKDSYSGPVGANWTHSYSREG